MPHQHGEAMQASNTGSKLIDLFRGWNAESFLTSEDVEEAADLARKADSMLFQAMCSNPQHVPARLFPQNRNSGYNMSLRTHNFELPVKDDRSHMSRIL